MVGVLFGPQKLFLIVRRLGIVCGPRVEYDVGSYDSARRRCSCPFRELLTLLWGDRADRWLGKVASRTCVASHGFALLPQWFIGQFELTRLQRDTQVRTHSF